MPPDPRPHAQARAASQLKRQRAERSRRAVTWGRSILLGSATVALVLAMRHLIDLPQQQRPAPAVVLLVCYLLTCWITLSGRLDRLFDGRRR